SRCPARPTRSGCGCGPVAGGSGWCMSNHPSTEPLWLATAGASSYAPLTGDVDVDVDVAIIGGGIAGITTALAVKRAGRRVAVLERQAVAAGATGFTTAKVSALQQTKLADVRRLHGDGGTRAYAQATVEAIDWMERLV